MTFYISSFYFTEGLSINKSFTQVRSMKTGIQNWWIPFSWGNIKSFLFNTKALKKILCLKSHPWPWPEKRRCLSTSVLQQVHVLHLNRPNLELKRAEFPTVPCHNVPGFCAFHQSSEMAIHRLWKQDRENPLMRGLFSSLDQVPLSCCELSSKKYTQGRFWWSSGYTSW